MNYAQDLFHPMLSVGFLWRRSDQTGPGLESRHILLILFVRLKLLISEVGFLLILLVESLLDRLLLLYHGLRPDYFSALVDLNRVVVLH